MDLSNSKIVTSGNISFRGYGIATGYLFVLPLFQAFTILLVLFKSNYNIIAKIFLIILITFSILVNARIGLTVLPVALLVYFLFTSKNIKSIIKKFVSLAIVILFVLISYYPVRNYLVERNDTARWVFTGIELSLGISDLNQMSTNERLIKYHLHFPSDKNTLLFGSGIDISMPNSSYPHSDIGYIQYIYYGGLFFLILFLIFYYNLLKPLIITKEMSWRLLYFASGIFLLIAHFKGDAFLSNSFTRALILVSYFKYLQNTKKISSS